MESIIDQILGAVIVAWPKLGRESYVKVDMTEETYNTFIDQQLARLGLPKGTPMSVILHPTDLCLFGISHRESNKLNTAKCLYGKICINIH